MIVGWILAGCDPKAHPKLISSILPGFSFAVTSLSFLITYTVIKIKISDRPPLLSTECVSATLPARFLRCTRRQPGSERGRSHGSPNHNTLAEYFFVKRGD